MSGEQSRNVMSYYNKSAQNYDRDLDVPVYRELYDKITWRYIEPYLPMKGKVLDAGGGTGRWTIPIAERGLRVVLCDISSQMLEVARKKAKEKGLEQLVTFEEGDICELDHDDNSFDFVLAEGDPISYCSDPNRAVGELARVLKPDRFAAAGVDSLFSAVRWVLVNKGLDEAFEVLRERRFFAEQWGFNCWAFSPDDLRKLFEGNGLEVVKVLGKTVVPLSSEERESFLREGEGTKGLLDLELMLCEEPSIAGYGGHLHAVGRKRAPR